MQKKPTIIFDPQDAKFVGHFTALFKERRRHHELICLYLRRLVHGRAQFFRFPASHRSDIMQDATLKAVQRIPEYDVARGDPVDYFNKVIDNCFKDELKEVRSDAHWIGPMEDGVEPASLERGDGLADARGKARPAARIPKAVSRFVGEALSKRIKKTVEIYNRSDADRQATLRIMLGTMQSIRREFTQEFQPIWTEGIRYTKDKCLHNFEDV